jgi:hypothetical protein
MPFTGIAARPWPRAFFPNDKVWPKGFASVVYGLTDLESGVELADQYLHLTGLVEVISILTQSSTMS